MTKVSEITGEMHEAMVMDIAVAYKVIEHIYNVIGTGFDKLDTESVSEIYDNLRLAKRGFYAIRAVLRNADKCKDEKS